MLWAARQLEVEQNGAERRRGLRIRQNRPAKVYEPGVGRYYGAQTHDVSATGLRLEMPLSTPLLPGRLLNVHVGVNGDGEALTNRSSMLPIRVVWVDRASAVARGVLVAGVEFISASRAYTEAA